MIFEIYILTKVPFSIMAAAELHFEALNNSICLLASHNLFEETISLCDGFCVALEIHAMCRK